MLRRSTACSTASSTAASCTVLRALATSPTSSRVLTTIGRVSGTSTSSPSGVSRIWNTTDGSRSVDISLAWRVRARSGRVIDRDTSTVTMRAASMAAMARAR